MKVFFVFLLFFSGQILCCAGRLEAVQRCNTRMVILFARERRNKDTPTHPTHLLRHTRVLNRKNNFHRWGFLALIRIPQLVLSPFFWSWFQSVPSILPVPVLRFLIYQLYTSWTPVGHQLDTSWTPVCYQLDWNRADSDHSIESDQQRQSLC